MEVNTKYGYIYKITNSINGKIYIGKRTGSQFDEDYWGSGTKLKVALKEFGKDNFKREILEWCSTKDILREREIYWIQKLNSRNPDIGYNIKKGGEGNREIYPFNLNGTAVVSLQIPLSFYDWLRKRSREECTTISYLIRKMIVKTMREEGENN